MAAPMPCGRACGRITRLLTCRNRALFSSQERASVGRKPRHASFLHLSLLYFNSRIMCNTMLGWLRGCGSTVCLLPQPLSGRTRSSRRVRAHGCPLRCTLHHSFNWTNPKRKEKKRKAIRKKNHHYISLWGQRRACVCARVRAGCAWVCASSTVVRCSGGQWCEGDVPVASPTCGLDPAATWQAEFLYRQIQCNLRGERKKAKNAPRLFCAEVQYT